MDLTTGSVVADRYRIGDRLGRGGMAVVYAAHDEVLDRQVAVKVLATHLLDDDRSVERFRREARAAAGLNHPNVVAVHDAASDGDVHFLVMELVAGDSLAHRLRDRGALPVAESLAIADRVAAALGAAHERGLVHRDVKPSNILLTPDGEVKVADFGIARAMSSAATQTAVVMGSVPYVAPEQLDGSSGADPRSDLYALGCVVFECLTGRPPFVADTSAAVLGQHLHLPPPAASDHRPEVSAAVDELVAALLAKDVADRPVDAAAVRARIARIQGSDGGGIAAVGEAVAVGGAAAVGVAAAGAARSSGEATRAVDPDTEPTQAVDPAQADATRRLDATDPAGAAPPTRPDPRTARGWIVGLLALALVGLLAFLVLDRPGVTEPTAPASEPTDSGDDQPTGESTPQPTTEPEPETTSVPADADPTPGPTSQPEPEPTSEPEPAPSTAPEPEPSTTPPPDPSTAPGVGATPTALTAARAAISDIQDVLARGQDTGQLTGDAPRALTARVSKVAERLASDDDQFDKAIREVDKLREEVDERAGDDEVGPGVANQLDAGIDDLEEALT